MYGISCQLSVFIIELMPVLQLRHHFFSFYFGALMFLSHRVTVRVSLCRCTLSSEVAEVYGFGAKNFSTQENSAATSLPVTGCSKCPYKSYFLKKIVMAKT